jgi:hypothetical protein
VIERSLHLAPTLQSFPRISDRTRPAYGGKRHHHRKTTIEQKLKDKARPSKRSFDLLLRPISRLGKPVLDAMHGALGYSGAPPEFGLDPAQHSPAGPDLCSEKQPSHLAGFR